MALARALAFVRDRVEGAADFGGLWFDCQQRGRRLTLRLRETLLDKGLMEGLHLFTSVICDAIQNASFPLLIIAKMDPAVRYSNQCARTSGMHC